MSFLCAPILYDQLLDIHLPISGRSAYCLFQSCVTSVSRILPHFVHVWFSREQNYRESAFTENTYVPMAHDLMHTGVLFVDHEIIFFRAIPVRDQSLTRLPH